LLEEIVTARADTDGCPDAVPELRRILGAIDHD
jgi:hypothetical protein